jgi:chemotaxis protein histidine kinase CheA
MATNRNSTPGTTKFSDHEVIVVPNRLRKAIKHSDGSDPDPVIAAEEALVELSEQFGNWMVDECAQLERARQLVHAESLTEATSEALYRTAHDIRGHGATFGFPIAADVADSLCRLIEHCSDLTQVPLGLMDQCVDAVRAIIRERDGVCAKRTAAELAKGLRALIDEYLNRHGSPRSSDPTTQNPPLSPE